MDPNVNHGSGDRVVPDRRVSNPSLSLGSTRNRPRGAKITLTRRPGRSARGRQEGELHAHFRPGRRSAALALALPVLFAGARRPGRGVFVETNPSTVPVGDEMGLRATCADNLGRRP